MDDHRSLSYPKRECKYQVVFIPVQKEDVIRQIG